MHSDENGSIRIVQLLNFDTYHAVWLNDMGELFLTLFLNRKQKEALKNNTLTIEDLLEHLYLWNHISELNAMFSKDIFDIIKAARESGYKEEITAGKWKLAKPLSEKEKKKAKEEAKKKESEERKWNKFRKISTIVFFASVFITFVSDRIHPALFVYSFFTMNVIIAVIIIAVIIQVFKEKD